MTQPYIRQTISAQLHTSVFNLFGGGKQEVEYLGRLWHIYWRFGKKNPFFCQEGNAPYQLLDLYSLLAVFEPTPL